VNQNAANKHTASSIKTTGFSPRAGDCDPDTLLRVKNLELVVAQRTLCHQLSFELHAGQRLAILGQNGSGKTSLLHTLINLRTSRQGDIQLAGHDLSEWPKRELARTAGILFQTVPEDMPASVHETVMLGRLPHLSGWRWESAHDLASVEEALSALELGTLAQRDVSSLSGGEQQRMAIASLLAQDPQLYLLDEPSNHLDISFQIKVLQLLSTRVSQNNRALIMATHDINLAARFCDLVLLLSGSGKYQFGATREVLTDENLSRAYQCEVHHVDTPAGTLFYPVA